MKTRIITFLLIVFCGVFGFSQNDESEEPKSLLSSTSKISGWFVDFHNSYSDNGGNQNYMPVFAGGVVVSRNFRLGLAAQSFSWYPEYIHYNDLFDEPVFLEGGYGGLYFEISTKEKKMVHFTFPIILGGGEYKYRTVAEYEEPEDEGEIDFGHRTLSHTPFFVIEPGVNLELNVTSFLKVYGGVSYRWLPGITHRNISNSSFNNGNFNFGVKIGKF